MAIAPKRPSHTGSARLEAQRQAQRPVRSKAPPTHLRLSAAAVALDLPTVPSSRPPLIVRRARQPLKLAGGEWALALRQREGAPVEVLLQSQGRRTWRSVEGVIETQRLKEWVRVGFG